MAACVSIRRALQLFQNVRLDPAFNRYVSRINKLSNSYHRMQKYKFDHCAITLQVIGNGVEGAPKSCYVFTDDRSFLFNCGEGTQRLLDDYKHKLINLRRILITSGDWSNMGGLPGLTLTLQEEGVKKYILFGPPKIENFVEGMKCYSQGLRHQTLIHIRKHEYFYEDFEDEVLSINSVPIFRSELRGNLDRRDMSLAYICKTHSLPGEMDLDKCVELNIPPGNLITKLKNGEDVTINGKSIKSQDVFTPATPSFVFIIIDCPSDDFLNSLLDCKQFAKQIPNLIVHFTPNETKNNAKYKQWMSQFPPSTQHLMLNESCAGSSNLGSVSLQTRLHVIDWEIFPLLQTGLKRAETVEAGNVILGEALLQYGIRPNSGFDRSRIDEYEAEVGVNRVDVLPEFRDKCDGVAENVGVSDIKYPQIIFLGTGSSVPNSQRNVPCILLQLNPNKWMILDCGEGSYNQMLKFFGPDKTADILKNMAAIFISHLHADHHLGLLQIIRERKKILDPTRRPFYLLGPSHMDKWLQFLHQYFLPIFNQFTFASNEYLKQRETPSEINVEMCQRLDLKRLTTVKTNHTALTYGLALTTTNGSKIVYSADTMPCDDLITEGQNCDLLIHEATVDDSLIEQARNTTHCTTSQAIDVGRRMRAKFVLLTHFSSRYNGFPIFPDNVDVPVGVAFDNMIVSLSNVASTALFKPFLEAIFTKEIEETLHRRDQRLMMKERIVDRDNNVGRKSKE